MYIFISKSFQEKSTFYEAYVKKTNLDAKIECVILEDELHRAHFFKLQKKLNLKIQ
jgi:hypothetical protein